MSLMRSRNRVRTAALRAEIVALRATITALQDELTVLRERAEAADAAAGLALAPTTLDLPLVRLALSDVAVDRSPDIAFTEIVLEPTRAPADRLAWSVLANLPERPLLDPRLDRDDEPVDHAADSVVATEDPVAPHYAERRSA